MANTPFPTSTPISPAQLRSDTASGSASIGTGSSDNNYSQSGDDRHEEHNTAEEQVASAAQTAHKLVDRAAERLLPAMDNLKVRADKASSAMHERIDQLDKVQQRWTDDSRSSIRSNPLTWVISALAVGMVLGRLRSGR